MTQLVGRIAIVQESRFRLSTPDGQSFLLTLHHGASVGVEDLRHYQRDRTEVVVEFSGRPGLTSGVAHSVRPR